REDYEDHYRTKKWTASSTLNQKFSAKSNLRAGLIASLISFDYYKKAKENDLAPLKEMINTKGRTQTVQAFAQWQYKPAGRLTLNGGFHYLRLLYNQTAAIEPRAYIKWQAGGKTSVAFAVGGHSQMQALGVYFAQKETAPGHFTHPNRELGLTRAVHYVVSVVHFLKKDLAVKSELYYQHLYKVPVSIYDSSTVSTLNIEREFLTDPLVNKGRGRNYGMELSLEKYLSNRLYYTVSTSLYESKYTAADGIERDTRFNGNYLVNFVAGKDFLSSGKARTFGINLKMIYAGGLRETPIDFDRSALEGNTVYKEKEAFTLQNPAYFRTDLRLSIKWDRQ
ncbi:MAG TPA: TonB-dependent receptor, partial [Chitinophagaceae bacterium]|nr:TonB-dependent receptor [Chitinophagaceae bacterium]